MSVENLFLAASKGKYRFESKVGLISKEDLWGLPETSATKANLEDIAILLYNEIKDKGVSFVSRTKVDPTLENKLEIVKYVIAHKAEAKAKLEDAAKRKAQRQAIHDLIEEKEQEGLRGLSIEQLKKLQEEL